MTSRTFATLVLALGSMLHAALALAGPSSACPANGVSVQVLGSGGTRRSRPWRSWSRLAANASRSAVTAMGTMETCRRSRPEPTCWSRILPSTTPFHLGERSLHAPPALIGEIAAQAKVAQLVLAHRRSETLGKEVALQPVIAREFKGPISYADDLSCFTIE